MGEKEQGKVEVYIGHSGPGNGKKGGWCYWVEYEDSDAEEGTHIRMEMYAVLNALRSIEDKSVPVEIFVRDTSIAYGINKQWDRDKNKDLWEKIDEEIEKFPSGYIHAKRPEEEDEKEHAKIVHQMAREQRDNA